MKPDRYSELAKIWISRAQDDAHWAKDSLDDKHYGGVCFLSQQIAEKSLKAYLFSKKVKLVRTHDLLKLLQLCMDYEVAFEKLKDTVQILNDYYIDTRYPDMWDRRPFDDKQLAEEAYDNAKIVLEFVKKKISS